MVLQKIQKLERFLSATLLDSKVAELVLLGNKTFLTVEEVYRLTFHKNQVLGFRAGWLLESIAESDPGRFAPVLPEFLSGLSGQNNLSCQRHFSKILMFVTDRKAPESYRNALAAADREAIVETVFGWLIDPGTPVAVSANCMDVLYYFSKEFSWVGDELALQVECLMDRGNSPALHSRGKRVLKKLG